MTDNKQYPPLPDFEEVEQHIYGVSRGYIPQGMLEPIHELMRAYVDADRAMRAGSQGDALDHGVREELSIGKAINRAARDLPEGWEIRIDLERHAGVVFLIDPDGNETMSEGGELFSDQINAAIDAALTRAQKDSND